MIIYKGAALTDVHTEMPATPGITSRHLGPGTPLLKTKQF